MTETQKTLYAEAAEALAAADTLHALNAVKAGFLGRGGILQKQLREIGALPQSERAAAGAELNALRHSIETLFENKKAELEQTVLAARLREEALDVTLPGRITGGGGIHPLQQTITRITAIFSTCGFEVAEGPEIETDYYNFTALNQPPAHPARSMQDTFYFAGGSLLRTHTSPVQIRHMEKNRARLPIRAISPGRVYRRDHDATHSPMFHQVEGLWIDEQVRFTDLKGILTGFFRAFFQDDSIVLRFRPSFFPFTEPSAECDMCRGDSNRWLEVGGCGMVHPHVLDAGGIDSSCYQGFAFGMGVERLAMLYYGITDLRLFFANDLRFLAQFNR